MKLSDLEQSRGNVSEGYTSPTSSSTHKLGLTFSESKHKFFTFGISRDYKVWDILH